MHRLTERGWLAEGSWEAGCGQGAHRPAGLVPGRELVPGARGESLWGTEAAGEASSEPA